MSKVSNKLQHEYHIQQLLDRILPSVKSDCFVMLKPSVDDGGHIQNESGSIKIPLNGFQVSFLISRGYLGEAQGQGRRLRGGLMERYVRQFTTAGLQLMTGAG